MGTSSSTNPSAGGSSSGGTGGGAGGGGASGSGDQLAANTQGLNVAAGAYDVLAGQFKRLAEYGQQLAAYQPLKGNEWDEAWKKFAEGGYQAAAKQYEEATSQLGQAMTLLAESIGKLSAGYQKTEEQNTGTAANAFQSKQQGGSGAATQQPKKWGTPVARQPVMKLEKAVVADQATIPALPGIILSRLQAVEPAKKDRPAEPSIPQLNGMVIERVEYVPDKQGAGRLMLVHYMTDLPKQEGPLPEGHAPLEPARIMRFYRIGPDGSATHQKTS